MRLIIDTFGADKGPKAVLQGTIEAMKKKDFVPVFVGNEDEITAALKKGGVEDREYEIVHTNVMVEHSDSPTGALREKKDSSLVKGLKLLKEDGDGMISCGSTGALLAGGTLIVKRMENVKRPAIMLNFPTLKGRTVFLDAGANADCTKELLNTFAVLASTYAEEILGKENPEVYLLNIGAEEGKGDQLRLETYELMKEADYNFQGNIETRDLFLTGPDVVVTDGFTGNMVLKTVEGVAMTMMGVLGEALSATEDKNVLKAAGKLKAMFDASSIGSAPILGVRKPLFKAHGSSDAKAFEQGIYTMIQFIEQDVNGKIREKLS